MDTLFELPAPKPKKKTKHIQKTQQYMCKRCHGSIHDRDGAYCRRFDLCLEFDDGKVLLLENNQSIRCDSKKWEY